MTGFLQTIFSVLLAVLVANPVCCCTLGLLSPPSAGEASPAACCCHCQGSPSRDAPGQPPAPPDSPRQCHCLKSPADLSPEPVLPPPAQPASCREEPSLARPVSFPRLAEAPDSPPVPFPPPDLLVLHQVFRL